MTLPTTGFEDRNLDGEWTTFAEEATYVDALLAAVPEIERETIGQGETGLDLDMFKIGTGDTHVLLIAQVHAGETSGRDALLSLVRDWATTEDASMLAYLQQVTLLVVPTMRPDSLVDRLNANGININRDHVHVSQSETYAVHQVVRDYQPVLAVDVHEGVNITNDYATSKVLNPNIAPGMTTLSDELEQAVKTAIEGDGYTWEPYQGHNIHGPEYGHNTFGLRHAVGLLLESRRTNLGGNIVETQRRYESQVVALNAILEWHAENLATVTDAVAASKAHAEQATEFHLSFGTSFTWQTIPAPDGYRLSAEDDTLLADPREVYELPERDDTDTLDARNHNRFIVSYLVDPGSSQALASGERQYEGANTMPLHVEPVRPSMYYQMGGVKYAARTAGGSVAL